MLGGGVCARARVTPRSKEKLKVLETCTDSRERESKDNILIDFHLPAQKKKFSGFFFLILKF